MLRPEFNFKVAARFPPTNTVTFLLKNPTFPPTEQTLWTLFAVKARFRFVDFSPPLRPLSLFRI